VLPIPIEAALLGPRLKTIPPTPPAPRFWQNNAPLQSSAVTIAFQSVRYATNLGVTMALARIIAPEDFGVFAMAVTFFGFLLLFKDRGVEPALVRETAVSNPELAALASLNACHGLLLAAACAALGPALAWLYGEPRLATAMLLPAAAFIFHGLDVQPGVLLLRAHRFRAHAAIETIAVLLGWDTTLLLATRDTGHWALFATEPVTAAALLLGHSWTARWTPRFSFAWSRVQRFTRFGRDVGGIRALDHVSRNVDNLILGLAAGPVSLAYYNRAFRLMALPQEGIALPLSRMAGPVLANLRDQPAEFVRAFRHLALTSIAFGLPVVGFLLVATPEIVAAMYGPRWEPVVPLVRLLALVGLCNTFYYAAGWIPAAYGNFRRQLHWEIIAALTLTVAFLAGGRGGAAGVAIAASLAYAGLRVPALLYCFRGSPVRLRDVGGVLWRPLVAALAGGALVLALRAFAGVPASPFIAVLRDGVIFVAGYGLGWVLVPGWRAFLRHELRRPEAAA
jgi:O-antigen/teichoic acid export membrane protein